MPVRRFPPPWSVEVQPNHYDVRDANKQQLAYVSRGGGGLGALSRLPDGITISECRANLRFPSDNKSMLNHHRQKTRK
jgi:hypothetical protein